MQNEHSTPADFLSALEKITKMSSFPGSSDITSESMEFFMESITNISVRQITNSRGETYPSDFGVGPPPLVSQEIY